jgi:hypothetical protein
MKINVDISIDDTIEKNEVVEIYKKNNWSAATIRFQWLKVYPDFSNAFFANGRFSDLTRM